MKPEENQRVSFAFQPKINNYHKPKKKKIKKKLTTTKKKKKTHHWKIKEKKSISHDTRLAEWCGGWHNKLDGVAWWSTW